MSSWSDVCEETAVTSEVLTAVSVNGEAFVLARTSAGICAFRDVCPHKGVALSETGDLCDDVLTCGEHLWEFDARDGAGINPFGEQLSSAEVRINNGRVELCLDPES
ncbi:MAG TPA: Rieske 2Fe-2S domain-containing protein [Sporichthyaceae bacterium]|jgi:toluene monooxygenase system ferredoxin subunit|nr:Rieske 2Fe-2S domain-containing protein [Sporichthyaceae bacterium]